ncbi:MAG: oligosaccharide flippase family protein [Solimonas sp.]
MSLKKFSASVAIYAGANLINKGAIFLSIPLFTRLFNPEDYGRWTLFLSAFSVLNLIFDFGLSRAIPRFYYDHDEKGKKIFFSTALNSRIFLTIALCLLYLLITPSALSFASRNELNFSSVGLSLLALCIAESIIQFALAFFRASENAWLYFSIRIGSTASQLILTFILIEAFKASVTYAALGYACGNVLTALLAMAVLLSRYRYRFHLPIRDSESKKLTAYGAPLLFHDLGTWMRNAADPFILVHFLTLSLVSTYSISVMAGLAIGLVAFSVDLAYTPLFYRMLKSDPSKGRADAIVAAEAYAWVMAGFVLIPILFSREIYSVVVPPQYSSAAKYASTIAIAYYLFVQYTIFIKPAFYQKKTAAIPFITMVPSALGLIINWIMVPKFGLSAPPLTWIFTFGFMAIAAFFYSAKVDPIQFNWKLPITLSLLLVLANILIKRLDSSDFDATSFTLKLAFLIIIIFSILFILNRKYKSWRKATTSNNKIFQT